MMAAITLAVEAALATILATALAMVALDIWAMLHLIQWTVVGLSVASAVTAIGCFWLLCDLAARLREDTP